MNIAIWFLLLAVLLFSLMNVGVKLLAHIPASELVLFRALITMVLSLFFIWKKRVSVFGNNKRLLLVRGLSGTLALFCFFTCLQKIPLAVAVTLFNLTPIFTVIIAHFYLKERAKVSQWFFLLLSFFGVVMVRGGVELVPWIWMFMGAVAAFFSAVAYTCVRELRRTEDPLVVIFYFSIVTSVLVGPVSFFQWRMPNGSEFFIILGIGVLTQIAQYFMTLAYQKERAAKIMIFNYTGLLWGLVFGWVLFSETLAQKQIVGISLVFTGLCGNYWVSLSPSRGVKVQD